jgi:MFS family permease
MEVPTGFIADRYGRRTSRIIGRVSAFASCLVMIGSHNFWGFALGFVLQALSFNLESGAGDALIYDSLVQCNKENEYMKVRGRDEIYYQLAHIISLVAGGVIATKSYELAYGIAAFIHLSALGISLSFEEPQISKIEKTPSLFQHMSQSLKAVWNNRSVLPYVFHLEVFSLYYTTLYFYFQNFMKSKGYVEYQIGFMLAATSVLGALAAASAYKIEKRLGKKKIILLTGFLPGILYITVALTKLEPVSMILLSAFEGFMFVVFGDYINKLIPSEHRATLLSFEAMIFSVMMIVFFPVTGAISEHYGFKTAFDLIACLSLITGCITTVFLLRKKQD